MCEIIEECNSKDDLNAKEIYYIERYDSFELGYNSTRGGDFNPMSYKENRRKASKSLKGVAKLKEHRKNISKAAKRYAKTEEGKKHYKTMMADLRKLNTGRKKTVGFWR